jgi:PadR family transcriptional regulator, regulatory protein PadR
MEINKDLIAASSTPIVLAILAEADSYGYAILQRVRELSGGRMEWTDGMLYPVLHRLERLGHVEARWEVAESGRRRKYYRITPQGRAQLAEERRQWQAVDATLRGIWQALSLPDPPGRASHAAATGSLSDDELHHAASLEEQIDQWRSYLRRRQAIHSVDVAELEDHLREQVAVLVDAGLATDEAFLVAVKRMGDLDALSREFAREHSERLWKQLVVAPSGLRGARARGVRTDAIVAFVWRWRRPCSSRCRRSSARLWTRTRASTPATLSLFVLPLLTGYFVWKRRLGPRTSAGWRWRSSRRRIRQRLSLRPEGSHRGAHGAAPADRALAGGGHRVRRRPLEPGRGPHGLHPLLGRAVHLLRADRARRRRAHGVHGDDLPGHRDRHRAVLRVVAAAVRRGRRRAGRLLAGGGQAERDREHGAGADAPLHAAVRRRAGHVPGRPAVDRTRIDIEREVLIAFDLLLVVVLGLLLYSVSARDPGRPRRIFDVLQVVLVVSALLADAVALWAIAARITEFGFTPEPRGRPGR